MRILISGAGIAGPTLAYWLTHYGFECTIVEKAPKLQVKIVNRRGVAVPGFPASAFSPATGGRYSSLARGDLAAAIFGKIQGNVESIFGDAISRIEQTDKNIDVVFESGIRRDFDLVIGADGLHSRVRKLVFGAEGQYEKYLGYKAAAFEVEGYRPRDELAYILYTQVGEQVARFAMNGDRTMFLLTFADGESPVSEDTAIADQITLLRMRFGASGWECPQILDALDGAKEFYFDRVSQIRMNREEALWTRGRVTLVGDAACCVSLLAGHGSALAMVAAYLLAGELFRAQGDHVAAFARYQELFGPFVVRKQKVALRFAGTFAPKSKLSLFLRNELMKMLRFSWIADLTLGREFAMRSHCPTTSGTGQPDSMFRMLKALAMLMALTIAARAVELSTKKSLNLAAIKAMVAAAEAEAAKRNVQVTICIVDESGNLLFLEKADGAPLNTIDFAQKKARHSANYASPSRNGAESLKKGNMDVLTFPDFFPNQGGLPIQVDGQTIGGIAASGAKSEIDEAIAQAGLDALTK